MRCSLLPQHVEVDGGRRWAARADVSGHLEQPSDLVHLALPGLDPALGQPGNEKTPFMSLVWARVQRPGSKASTKRIPLDNQSLFE